jgi:thymidylate synthase
MHLSAGTLDDLLLKAFKKILQEGDRVKASKGWNTELFGVLLELKNPTARLSRTETKGTVFSCLGETLWYLGKSNELSFIEYYISGYGKFSDDGKTVHGAYGPRIFSMRHGVDQIHNVIGLLRKKPSSRQAVIQIFNAEDLLKDYKDIPCTCTLQFLIRKGYLHAVTHMRSNDAFLGLPHDVFAFTFFQEILARTLGLKLGTYKHAVGSLHIYDEDLPKVRRFVGEGWQARIAMPEMPTGNPWPNIARLLSAEQRIRKGQRPSSGRLSPYWADLIRLLQVFALTKEKKPVDTVATKMTSSIYGSYIKKRVASKALATVAH